MTNQRRVIWALLSAACLAGSCGPRSRPIPGSAEQIRADCQARAKAEGKLVFLLFTVPDASWCQVFADYHADPQVGRIIGDHFVVATIDAAETPGGDHMYLEYGGANTFPSFTLLDSHGMVLANSGEGDQNIGFPTSPEEVERYFATLKAACPELTSQEIEILRQKLAEYRPQQEPEADGIKPAPSAAAPECRMSPRTKLHSA